MKTKIVERLLKEENITVEEAVVLLEEKQQIGFQQFPSVPVKEVNLVPYHTVCGCEVCHCVMGNNMVDPNSSGNYTIQPVYTATATECLNGIKDCDCTCSNEEKK